MKVSRCGLFFNMWQFIHMRSLSSSNTLKKIKDCVVSFKSIDVVLDIKMMRQVKLT